MVTPYRIDFSDQTARFESLPMMDGAASGVIAMHWINQRRVICFNNTSDQSAYYTLEWNHRPYESFNDSGRPISGIKWDYVWRRMHIPQQVESTWQSAHIIIGDILYRIGGRTWSYDSA